MLEEPLMLGQIVLSATHTDDKEGELDHYVKIVDIITNDYLDGVTKDDTLIKVITLDCERYGATKDNPLEIPAGLLLFIDMIIHTFSTTGELEILSVEYKDKGSS